MQATRKYQKPGEGRQLRMQREEVIERQGRQIPRHRQGDILPVAGVSRIADGGDRRQAVERAAENDDNHTRVARRRRSKPGHRAKRRRPDGNGGNLQGVGA